MEDENCEKEECNGDCDFVKTFMAMIDTIDDDKKQEAYVALDMIHSEHHMAIVPVFSLVLKLSNEVRDLRKSNDNLANLLADKINEE